VNNGDSWIPEIQFLRAVAVTLVLAFHAFPNTVPGGFIGVDLFFVLSGFLIHRQIAEDIRRSQFSLPLFYVRRAMRLLPAASLVLVASLSLGLLFVSEVRWFDLVTEARASVLYWQNWHLLATKTDYFAAGSSLLQHFWSLSVEEQFYLVWPGWLLLLTAADRATPRLNGAWLKGGVVILLISSLALSVLTEDYEPELAYFGTHLRAWEFAAGALFSMRRPSSLGRLSAVFACLGMGLIVSTAFLLNAENVFPGWAILPVGGASLLLIAKIDSSALQRMFQAKIVRVVAELSYSLYLWHWPLFVLARERFHSPFAVPVATLVSVGLAALTYRYVETPLRFRKGVDNRRALSLATTAVLGASVFLIAYRAEGNLVERPSLKVIEQALDQRRLDCLGAQRLLQENCSNRFGQHFAPDPTRAAIEVKKSRYARRCILRPGKPGFRECKFGKRDAKHHLFLFGDSHALQWGPAFDELANAHGYRLTMAAMGSCPPNLQRLGRGKARLREHCQRWVEEAVRRIKKDPSIDLVITSAMNNTYWKKAGKLDAFDSGVDGYVATWRQIERPGLRILVLGDTPRPKKDHLECVVGAKSERDLAACSHNRKEAVIRQKFGFERRSDPLALAAEKFGKGALYFDPTQGFCESKTCPAVIGNVLVFHDAHHMTPFFARTFEPTLEKIIEPLLRKD